MSSEAAKQVEKSGLRMTKDKLQDLIRKSSQKEFMFSPCQNSKDLIVTIKP